MTTVRADIQAAMRQLKGGSRGGGEEWSVNSIIRTIEGAFEEYGRGERSGEDLAELLYSGAYLMNRHVFGEGWSPERDSAMRKRRGST